MIHTNQMEIDFDFEAIAKDFSIFEARRDQGNYWKSRVPDVALQECKALAVVYERGPSCYILYHRASVEQHSLKQVLECCEDNVRVQEISAQEMAETKKHLLAQLLCNALPSIQANGELYHNVTGNLYYMQPSWVNYRKEVLASFWTLQISFTKDCCVKLDVKTFSNARLKQGSKNKPQYLFDPECYILRRALRDDPGNSTDRFVIGALNQRRKNTIPFLEFGSLTDYQNCKVGILHQFLRDVRKSLSPYLSLTMVSLDESTHLGVCGSVDSMTGIRNRLRETPLYLEDTVRNEQSRTLISMLRYELAQYSEVTFMEGTPEKGDALLRIIHHPLFYEDHPEDDEYLKAPKHCVVQHITVEDFQLTGMNARRTKEKEDHKLLKVIQELAIKIDISRRQMSCYDWAKLGVNRPVTFVMASSDYKDKSEPICYDMLRIQPGGELYFESWQQSFWEDNSEREKISAAFETPHGKFNPTIKGLVYEEENNIHIIYDTDRYTLPNMQDLEQVLSATRDDEQVPAKPLVETVQKYADSLSGNESVRCQMILDEINQHGMQVSRKELRHILNLRSNLGKQINRFIFEETGVLIGNTLKSARNKEALFGGVLGIRHFCKDGAQYYYSGYLGSSLNRTLPHACRIRRVCSTGPTLQFQHYLPLLEVDFVRASGWPVIPFPFKYLHEWKAQ
ncbi:hypothetical protein [Pseudoflavonifractor sp. An85]|uniref:hypothetical protein n=1 Tax=Pseudoflavonifractor sp. An85 TaxID=1965661 RepID=UPI000B3ABE49|nr:hypothetical protein [Pseudoflavonifractor sp. An85]OUN25789.1 hypothetical protein B5G37_02965 [Pseudoflavonifractor sp. An85]